MKNYEWMPDASRNTSYYYNVDDGRIVGQTTNITHTGVWVAKIVFNHNEEKYLGQYISEETCKRSVMMYWEIENRTLLE